MLKIPTPRSPARATTSASGWLFSRPRLSSGDTLDHFVVEDVRSKGLELEKLDSVTDTLGQTYVEGTDYTCTEETVTEGTRMLLTFTQQGLQKLDSWAGQRGR